MPDQRRQLAAIMFTDIAGYTALMGKDEDRAFEILRMNKEIHTEFIEKYHGSLIKELGDGLLVSFNSSVDAVRCAIEIQAACKEKEIPLKIGIHEGDMVFAGEDVLGDGVNVASRLESVTEKGNITISEAIYKNIRNKPSIYTAFVEEKLLKNVDEPVKVYQVSDQEIVIQRKKSDKKFPLIRGRILPFITSIFVIAAAIILLWIYVPRLQHLINNSSNVLEAKSIAVLPFHTFTNDTSQQYIAEGVSKEIHNKLLNIAGIKVSSRTSSDTYRNSSKRIPEIAEELGVAAIMEGDAERFGDSIRVRVRLIDGKTDFNLWYKEFDQQFSGIWEIYTEIAEMVASELEVAITPEQKRLIATPLTTNMEAYDYLLKAREEIGKFWHGRNMKNLENAEKYWKKAFELDPDSEMSKARNWGFKGNAYYMRYYQDKEAFLNSNYLDSAIWYYQVAKAILPEVIIWPALGEIYYSRGDIDLAVKNYEEFLNSHPDNFGAMGYLAYLYIYTNKYVEGISMIRKAYKLNKNEPQINSMLVALFGYAYELLGEYEKAEYYIKEAMDLGNCFYATFYPIRRGDFQKAKDWIAKCCYEKCEFQKAEIYLQSKEYKKALDNFRYVKEWWEVKRGRYWSLDYREGYALIQLGRPEEGNELIDRSLDRLEKEKKLGRPTNHDYHLAAIYAFRNDTERALRYLEDYKNQVLFVEDVPYQVPLDYSQHDILFENLWENPRFKAIIKKDREKKEKIRAHLRDLEERGEIDLSL